MTMPHSRRAISSLLFLLLLSFTGNGSAATFTVEQVLSSPFPSNLVAASRLGRVAWVFNAKGSRNVWMADIPSFAARSVTHYSGDDGRQSPACALPRMDALWCTCVVAKPMKSDESRIHQRRIVAQQQVWAIDADGDSPRLLGDMGCGEEGCEPLNSPDGQFAVWATRKQLWIAPVSGATSSHH